MRSLLKEGLSVTAASDDVKEAARAFAEKREHVFKGE